MQGLCPTCPAGYTATLDGRCVKTTSEGVIPPPGGTVKAQPGTNNVYSSFGTLIYNPGYNINGVGSFTQIATSNTYWINTGGVVNGPLNRTGLWAPLTSNGLAPPDEEVGFSYCIDVTTPKTYYAAFGCDNFGIIKLDGTVVVRQTLATLVSTFGHRDRAFKYWHVYPLYLTAGPHIIEILGKNEPGTYTPATIGAEIYDKY